MAPVDPIDSLSGWERGEIWVDDHGHDALVEHYGVGDPSDPILIFVHGWGLSPTSYRRPINALAEDGWYVIAPTLPGFGSSTPVHGTRQVIPSIANRFNEVLTELAIDGSHPVVAHSLGCGVAAGMINLGSPYAKSLTLVCPIGAAGNAATSWAQMAVGLRKEIGRDTAARIADALPNMLRHPLAVAASGVAAKHADLITEFHSIAQRMPIHVILADGDGVIARDKLHHLYDKDGIQVTTVHGSHGWMLTAPRNLPPLVDQTQLAVLHRETKRHVSG